MFFGPGNFPDFADHVGVITSVSSDGTIDMVNGDFAATPDVHAEYDTGITSLSSLRGVRSRDRASSGFW